MTAMLCGSDTKAPNIIFFLADDLGYMDLAAYASHVTDTDRSEMFYETPNIDGLIDAAVMFTQAYANPLCSPTRSSVITGKYAARQGFMTATPGNYETYYNQGKAEPKGFYAQDGLENKVDRSHWPLTQGITNIALPVDEITFAETLEGYNAAFIGKWHLGGHGSAGYSPASQGFDEIAWFDSGGSSYFDWRSRWDQKTKIHPAMDQPVLLQGNSGELTGEDYLTDDLAAQASRYIKMQAKTEKPFMLYFCHFAVHSPFEAKKEDIDYFKDKSTLGWNGHANPVYAGMLKALDDSVGTVLKALEESGQRDNTVIIFMSDNGGIVHPDENGHPQISNNAPLKGEKALMYEGGIRVPLFVWYPENLTPKVCNVPVDCNDIFPTVLELAGQSLESYNEYGDGESLVPLFTDPNNRLNEYTRDTFFWHYPFYVGVALEKGGVTAPRSVIRKGDWKLILDWEGTLELYNLNEDISEANDLSGKNPERTMTLFKELVNWLNTTVETRYIPKQNSQFDPHHKDARTFENIFARHNTNWPTGRSSRAY